MKHTAILLVAAAAAASACSKDNSVGPPVPAAVVVTPGADTLVTLGRTRQFSAVAQDQNGDPITGVTLVWHSSNPSVATVDSATGLATAVGNGLSVISAHAGAVAGQATFAVAQVVASVTVTPGSAALTSVGLTKAFTAVAKDSGGATVAGVRFLWLSSDNTVAVVDTLGVAKSKGPGQAIITAAGRGVPGNAVLTVTQNGAHLVFIGAGLDVVAGGAFVSAIQVEIEDSGGAVVTGSHAPVTIAVDSGPAGTLTGTLTAAPSGGVATFIGVGYDGLDGTHALLATAAGADSGVSPAFAVAPGPVAQVRWAVGDGIDEAVGDTEPEPGAPWTYYLVDRFGNLATTSTDSVRLIVRASEWGSHLRGPTALMPSNGYATFSGFWFDRPGQSVSIAAVANSDTSAPAGTPFQDTLPPLSQVAVGDDHACAVGGNRAFCWGSNASGDLGDGSTLPDSVPVLVQSQLLLKSVVAFQSRSCGLDAGGAAYCWGYDYIAGIQDSVPAPVAGGLTFTKLSMGLAHICGLTAGGDVYCWGSNSNGQLGDGHASGLSSLTPVLAAGGHTFTDVAANYLSTCAIASGGDAYCWGFGTFGQLGTGSTADDSVPTLVQGGLKFSQISLGFSTTCGVAVDSLAYCWGANDFGALGDSTTASDSQPVAVHGGIKFKAVATGGSFFSCGVAIDKELWCWGQDGPAPYGLAPGDLGVTGDTLSVAQTNACIVQSGVVRCWGSNSEFQLGNGTSVDVPSPQPIVDRAPPLRSVARPSAGTRRRTSSGGRRSRE